MPKIIARFSCGAASAVATKLAMWKYGKDEVEIYYNDTGSEHPDNVRFIKDCEEWFGKTVHVLASTEFKDTWEVWEKRRFLVSPQGAPCTGALKRVPGEAIWNVGDTEIFGFTADEGHRLIRLRKDNCEKIIEAPLIDMGITKQRCFEILQSEGIVLPVMYRLGFRNNNCIACVKARDSPNYWKRIRKHFPDHFNRMAKLERELGFTINRLSVNGVKTSVFLDELPEGDPKEKDDVSVSCGFLCEASTPVPMDDPLADEPTPSTDMPHAAPAELPSFF